MTFPFLTPTELESLARRSRDAAQLAVAKDIKKGYQNMAQICEFLAGLNIGPERPVGLPAEEGEE